MPLADALAALNATLNATSGVLLLCGRRAIRRGRRDAHRRLMIAAFATSCVFLMSYVTRFALSGTHRYPDDAPLRGVYLVVLATHVTLAATVPFLALRLLWLALRRRDFARHARIARIAWPVWICVSATGVIVYAMLYHLA